MINRYRFHANLVLLFLTEMITLTCLYSKTFFPLNILLASLFNVYFQSRVFGGLNDDTLVEMPFWRHTIRTGKAAEGCALSSESVDEIL